MITKFKEYKKIYENVPFDTYNGPPITQFPENTLVNQNDIAGGNGGRIGGEWYSAGGPTSKGSIFKTKWNDDLKKPISNESDKRKKAIKKINALLQMDLEKTLNTDD